MKVVGFFTVVAISSALTFAAEADSKGKNGNSARGHSKHNLSLFCPPGLAKKDPPCIPPGQAKGAVTPEVVVVPVLTPEVVVVATEVPPLDYNVGDILPDHYVILADPRVFNPLIDVIYANYGGYLYVVERASDVVLIRLGPTSDWTWVWNGTDAADTTGCPPGLAKKDPPCIPPGLAAQNGVDVPDDPYGIGERLPAGYAIAIDPKLYTPNDWAQFVREGDGIYRADATTGEVLDQVGPVGKIIN